MVAGPTPPDAAPRPPGRPPGPGGAPARAPGAGRWGAWQGLDPRVWQMAVARAVNTMGLSLVMSFLGVYVVETRGHPAWRYGVIALLANLAQSLSNAWAGGLSDRVGRLPLITGSLALRSVVIAALGTQILLAAPLWSLGLTMVASSALRGCFEPVAYALVSDVVDDDQRIAAFGLQRLGTNVGWAVGPAMGGLLSLVVPYGAIFYVASAGLVGAALLTRRVVDPVAPRARDARDATLAGGLAEALGQPLLRLLLLGTLLCALLETQMFSTLSIYLTDRVGLTKAAVGALYSLNGVAVLCLQLPALALIRRLGLAVVLPLASLLDAGGFALIALATGFRGGALAILTLSAAEVLLDPAHQAAVAECADPARRGRVFGVVGFAQTVGIAGAPLLGGALLDALGDRPGWLWLGIASIGVAQAACFGAFVRRRRRG